MLSQKYKHATSENQDDNAASSSSKRAALTNIPRIENKKNKSIIVTASHPRGGWMEAPPRDNYCYGPSSSWNPSHTNMNVGNAHVVTTFTTNTTATDSIIPLQAHNVEIFKFLDKKSEKFRDSKTHHFRIKPTHIASKIIVYQIVIFCIENPDCLFQVTKTTFSELWKKDGDELKSQLEDLKKHLQPLWYLTQIHEW